jgi:hypothetical protein
MKTYEQKIAEAVRDAMLQIYRRSGVMSYVDLDAIIASVPRPEPVCMMDSGKKSGVAWSDAAVLLKDGDELYAALVSAEPVNARLLDAAKSMREVILSDERNVRVLNNPSVADILNGWNEAIAAAEQAKPVHNGNRKVYICKHCEAVYADQPPSSCDCCIGVPSWSDGYIAIQGEWK